MFRVLRARLVRFAPDLLNVTAQILVLAAGGIVLSWKRIMALLVFAVRLIQTTPAMFLVFNCS